MLEALQWEESELVEPTVYYGEKPPIYEVSLKLESDAFTVRQDTMPLSLNPTYCIDAEAQSIEERIVHGRQSPRHPGLLRRLTNLLLKRPRFLRTETPNLPMEESAHDTLSVAFIIAMPGDSRDKFADEGVLPELQLGFRNLNMLGNASVETVSR
ncbi:hypothetical protein FS837_006348 [Tulasnella sp. UAMH 9824]|nr:hypothetical protein FS837_006348 [Tulasnella sp. UAMH 9824]